MAESAVQNPLEQEIAQIEQDLASKRKALEHQKQAGAIPEMPHEKETLREIVGEKIAPPPASGPASVPPPSAPAPQQQTVPPPPSFEPPSYLSEELKVKVQELINTAFTKTIDDAIKQARAANNAALIDAFHDALVDELYNYLVERGKLKKM